MFRMLNLFSSEKFVFTSSHSKDWIESLSQINLIVGTNNSGKSRLLRMLFQTNNLKGIAGLIENANATTLINKYKQTIGNCIGGLRFRDYHGIRNTLNNLPAIPTGTNNTDFIIPYMQFMNSLLTDMSQRHHTYTIDSDGFGLGDPSSLNSELYSITSTFKSDLLSAIITSCNYNKVYIPTLRGLRNSIDSSNDLYKQRTIHDYFQGDPNLQDSIFTGLELFKQVQNLLLGTLTEREKISNFQDFLGNNFFDGQKVALIPRNGSDVLFVKIGNEAERPIFDLGDGIQSIIILTFPLFAHSEESLLVFIEEPEIFMHPGLQRKLLETLTRPEFKNFQYFISTHSNHLLDISLDIDNISIYSIKKEFEETSSKELEPRCIVETVSTGDNQLLSLLGVKKSSVFLSNCTIWVEGITDRLYLRHYFKIYQQSFKNETVYKEDIHFSFVEYGGNNITHWSFLDNEEESDLLSTINVDRLCSKLLLITDKDSDKKLGRQNKLKEKLHDRYYCLPCKEIENLLTKNVLIKVIEEYEKKPPLFHNTSFAEKDYSNKYLGTFIEQNLSDKNRQGSYASKSGTISDKLNFCKRALHHINNTNDLTPETIKLCQKIYEFITENNK